MYFHFYNFVKAYTIFRIVLPFIHYEESTQKKTT